MASDRGSPRSTTPPCRRWTQLTVRVQVNGEEWATGVTEGMIYSPAELIAYVSIGDVVQPGDIIGSGTVGNGSALELGRHLSSRRCRRAGGRGRRCSAQPVQLRARAISVVAGAAGQPVRGRGGGVNGRPTQRQLGLRGRDTGTRSCRRFGEWSPDTTNVGAP